MVKKIITITIIVLLMTSYSVAKAQQKNPTVEDFFGSYRAVSFVKVSYCYPTETQKAAEKNLNKMIELSQKYSNTFWRELQTPRYIITRHAPAKEEGEVYPRHLRRIFQTNGIYEDQVTLLTVAYPPDNLPYKDFKPISYNPTDYPFTHFEIVNSDTLLYRSGCWTYTLKRIK
jgi:hypothetical protein